MLDLIRGLDVRGPTRCCSSPTRTSPPTSARCSPAPSPTPCTTTSQDAEELFVARLLRRRGPDAARFRPRARGRATPHPQAHLPHHGGRRPHERRPPRGARQARSRRRRPPAGAAPARRPSPVATASTAAASRAEGLARARHGARGRQEPPMLEERHGADVDVDRHRRHRRRRRRRSAERRGRDTARRTSPRAASPSPTPRRPSRRPARAARSSLPRTGRSPRATRSRATPTR